MPGRESGWERSSVIVRAVFTGSVVCLAGTVVWFNLRGPNLTLVPSVPWAVPGDGGCAMALWALLGRAGPATVDADFENDCAHRPSRRPCGAPRGRSPVPSGSPLTNPVVFALTSARAASAFGRVALHGVSTCQAEAGQRAPRKVHHHPSVVNELLEFRCSAGAVVEHEIGVSSHINRAQEDREIGRRLAEFGRARHLQWFDGTTCRTSTTVFTSPTFASSTRTSTDARARRTWR